MVGVASTAGLSAMFASGSLARLAPRCASGASCSGPHPHAHPHQSAHLASSSSRCASLGRARVPPRASPRALASLAEDDDEEDAKVLERVTVLVCGATDLFPRRAREAIASRPNLVRALRRGNHHGADPDDHPPTSPETLERHVAAVLAFLGGEMGLDPPRVGALVARDPALLAMDVEERLRPTFAALVAPAARGGAGLTKSAAADALCRDSTLFALSLADQLEPRLRYLVDDLGVRPRDAPSLLSKSTTATKSTFDFLRVECGLGTAGASAMVRKDPGYLSKDVDATMRPALRAMRAMLSEDETAKVLARYPNTLLLTPENLTGKLRWFSESCGLGEEAAAKLIARAPVVFTLSVEDNLAPKYRFLCEEIGLGDAGTRHLVARCPQVLCLSRENVEPKFRYLVRLLGRDGAISLVTRMPATLSFSLEKNIIPTVEFMREACAEEGEGAVADVLRAAPSALSMSVERKLRPTLTFLRARYPDIEPSAALRMATFSLDGNIAPRVRLLERRGMRDRWKPSTFLVWNVGKFCEKTGTTRDEYDAEVDARRDASDGGEDESTRGEDATTVDESPAGAIRTAIRAQAAPVGGETPAERARARRAAKLAKAAEARRSREVGDETAEG